MLIKRNFLTLLLPWMVWFLASLVYFHQYYLRISVSGLSQQLGHEFFLTVLEATDLSVLFFISYVIMLPIAGILLDYFGVKKLLPLSAILSSIACFIFAFSTDYKQLTIARIIMGTAASFSSLSAFIIIKTYFPSRLFPLLSGLTLGIGVLGGILADGPLALASDYKSWRLLMAYAGWFILLVGLILLFLIKTKTTSEGLSINKFFNDIKLFLRQFQNWLPGLYGGLMLTPIVVFASFWAKPLLILYYQINFKDADFLASVVFIGYALGAPLLAVLAQQFGIRLIMLISALFSAVIMLLLVHFIWSLPVVIFLLLAQGFGAGAFTLSAILMKQIAPAEMLASALSFSAMLAQLLGVIILWSLSWIIHFWYHHKTFHLHTLYTSRVLLTSLHLLIIVLGLAVVVAYLIKPISLKPR